MGLPPVSRAAHRPSIRATQRRAVLAEEGQVESLMSIRLSETSRNGLMPDHFSGEVILPGDRDYEDARRVWNGMIDRKPRAVLRARAVGDIEPAVTMAARHGLPLADPRGRPQRRGPRHRRRRPGPRSRCPQRGRGGRPAADRPRPARRDHRRRGPGDAGPRAGRPARGGLRDRRGRADPGRRHRLAHPPARPDHRQPHRRRPGHRLRHDRPGRRDREPRAVVGHPWRRRQLRRDLVVHLPGASAGAGGPHRDARLPAAGRPRWPPTRPGPATCPTRSARSSPFSCRPRTGTWATSR